MQFNLSVTTIHIRYIAECCVDVQCQTMCMGHVEQALRVHINLSRLGGCLVPLAGWVFV